MGLNLSSSFGPGDFLQGLLGADPAAAIDAHRGDGAMDMAYAAAGLRPAGPEGVLQAFGIGPSLTQQVQAQQQVAAQQAQAVQQAREQRRQAMLDQARQAIIQDPSASNFNRLFALDPQNFQAIKAQHDALDEDQRNAHFRDVAALRGYASAGDAQGFQTAVQARIDAEKKAGGDTSSLEHWLELSQTPQGLDTIRGELDSSIAAGLGATEGAKAIEQLRTAGETERAHRATEAQQAADLAEKAREADQTASKPVVVAKDSVLVDPGGGGGGATPPAAAPNGSGSPRGLRNNNPLNLRPNPHATWAGQTGTDSGNFAQFATPEAGWAAADKNLIAKPSRHGLNTLGQIIGDPQWGWAPARDGNDPAAYAQHVAAAIGIDPNADISAQIKSDPTFRHRLLGAMASVEVGRPMQYGQGAPQGAPQAQGGGARVLYDNRTPPDPADGSGLTGEPLLASLSAGDAGIVKAIAEGRLKPPTLSRNNAASQRIMQLVTQYDPTFDQADPQSRQRTRIDFTSGKSAQNITALNTAIGHLNDLDYAITGLNNTSLPLNNKAAHFIAGATGTDARVQRFETYKTAVTNELTRVFRGSNGAVQDIQDWKNRLDAASSPETLHAVVQAITEAMNSRLEELGNQYNQGLGRSEDPIHLLAPDRQAMFARMHQGVLPEQARQSVAPAGTATAGRPSLNQIFGR